MNKNYNETIRFKNCPIRFNLNKTRFTAEQEKYALLVTCKAYNYQVITIIGLLFPRLTTLSSSNDVGFSNRVIFIHINVFQCIPNTPDCCVYLYISYYYNFVSFIAPLLYYLLHVISRNIGLNVEIQLCE